MKPLFYDSFWSYDLATFISLSSLEDIFESGTSMFS